MEEGKKDKKVIAIIVISSFLFVMTALSIALFIIVINNNNLKQRQVNVNELVIVHNEEGGFGTITGYTGKRDRIILPNSYSVENGKVVEGETFKIVAIGENAFKESFVKEVVVPSNISIIGKSAFYGAKQLTLFRAINILGVEDYAFSGCSNLNNVEVFSTKSFSVGNYAFYGCSSLSELNFLSFVNSVGDYAFSGCLVSEVVFESKTQNVGNYAFNNCSELISVCLPDNLEVNLGKDLFIGCFKLSKLVGRGNVEFSKLINSQSNNITFNTIEFYESEETIKEKVITNFSKLSKVVFSENVTQIQNGAFEKVGIVEVIETPSVYEIGYDFDGVREIKKIKLIPTSFSSEVLPYYARECNLTVEEVEICEGITKIKESAFYGLKIKRLVLPSTLVGIDTDAFKKCEIKYVYINGQIECLNNVDLTSVINIFVEQEKINYYKENYPSLESKFSYGENI